MRLRRLQGTRRPLIASKVSESSATRRTGKGSEKQQRRENRRSGATEARTTGGAPSAEREFTVTAAAGRAIPTNGELLVGAARMEPRELDHGRRSTCSATGASGVRRLITAARRARSGARARLSRTRGAGGWSPSWCHHRRRCCRRRRDRRRAHQAREHDKRVEYGTASRFWRAGEWLLADSLDSRAGWLLPASSRRREELVRKRRRGRGPGGAPSSPMRGSTGFTQETRSHRGRGRPAPMSPGATGPGADGGARAGEVGAGAARVRDQRAGSGRSRSRRPARFRWPTRPWGKAVLADVAEGKAEPAARHRAQAASGMREAMGKLLAAAGRGGRRAQH